MSPRIKPNSRPLPPPPRKLLRFQPRAWLCILLLISFAITGQFLWSRAKPTIAQNKHYLLVAENVTITPTPPWIRSDIKAQALRDAGLLGTLSVLDDWDLLSRRIKEAFEFHPWVASVNRITRKLPGSLDVELTYRKPIAAVESSDANGIMFLPIDANGVRLPEADLSEAERRYLPRISGITGRPLIGDKWDDPRVIGGANLAQQLADVWQQLRLVEIIAAAQSSPRDEKQIYRFEIVTTGGTRILWGMKPGDESSTGESPFSEKRKRLLDYASQHGKLESIDGPAVLDVRSDLVVTPRTARHKTDGPKGEATQTK
jgi:hypothetical protein